MHSTILNSTRRRVTAVLVGALLGIAASLEVAASDDHAVTMESASDQAPTPATGPRAAQLSSRTVSVAVAVDRDSASVVAFTLKDRPFARMPELAPPRPVTDSGPVQLEVALLGPGGASFVQRLDVNGLCLMHSPDTPAHVEGDTIRLHRETIVVEVPEMAGFETIEVGFYGAMSGLAARTTFGPIALAADRFTPAGGQARYRDLAFASASIGSDGDAVPLGSGTVHWPEEYSDPDIYKVYGSEAEGDRRINIVIVPDGYTYAEKSLMQSHAQAMVNFFRSRTPFAEHDSFVNYTLIYAYSTQSGTDECDCNVVKATAMNTRFPLSTPTCGHSDNRCLYYGTGNGGPNCDSNTSITNIVAAELRAPVLDTTLIMVNTPRYGGCGGNRAVYSAGNGAAVDVALHELGHSLAGLADEYAYTAGCGTSAGEVNTSQNATSGAWPEWIADIGAPSVGAQYYQSCVYRPLFNCEMRVLGVPYCPVCTQRWALTYFGWPRISPTAPIESSTPPPTVQVLAGDPTDFSVTTRLATGVSNTILWRLLSPGSPSPVVVASGPTSYTHTFPTAGDYTLSCEVTADTNLIKPQRTGANRDTMTWTIHVEPDDACVGVADGSACDDFNPCTASDTCQSGECVSGCACPCVPDPCHEPYTCSANGDCNIVAKPEGAACDDGDACTQGESCHSGACASGTPLDCNDNNPCRIDSCDSAVGCQHWNAQEGIYCDDGNGCTVVDVCQGGACVGQGVRDADHDSHADAACGGDDCDDLNENTYPGALEVNDGQDNQCLGNAGFGVIDEISGVPFFDDVYFCWPEQVGAAEYDAVRSDQKAFASCVSMIALPDACSYDDVVPAPNSAYYYLVRAVSPHSGSWGQASGGAERNLSCP